MSVVFSISGRRRYGLARVCRVWDVPRAGIYRRRRAANLPETPRRRPGPQGPMPDATLVEEIQTVLSDSPFHGEGYRKVWARLRHKGVRTSKERVRRLMRENGLSADTGQATPRGPRAHDDTIIPETVDTMWDEPLSAIDGVDGPTSGIAMCQCGSSEAFHRRGAIHGQAYHYRP